MPNFCLSTRIKMLRERERMTREELAQKIGVSYSAIAMYERSEREPDNEKLLKIAETFNVTTDYLLGNKDIGLKEDLEARLKRLYLDKYEFEMAVKTFKHDYFDLENDDSEIFELSNRDNINTAYQVLDDIFSCYLVDTNGHFIKTYSDLSEKEKDEIYNIIDNLDFQKFLRNFDNNYSTPQFYMCPVYGRISAGQPNWAEENIEGRIPVPMTGEIDNPEECFYLKVNGESMNKVVKNGAYALIHKQDIVEDGEIAVVLVNGYDATLKKFSKQGDFVVLEPMSDVTDDPDIKTQIYDKSTSIKILGKYIGKFEMNG
ncbi:MAG: helix-turn-helix domain-containing protein [Clostridia bacterium]|nr:helix-turn-helix domain-containing protein [Clostridia bacterium]